MPIHDWTRVSAGTFHDFHNSWITHLKEALNAGLLPQSYYAMGEQQAGDVGPDILTLKGPEAVQAQAQFMRSNLPFPLPLPCSLHSMLLLKFARHRCPMTRQLFIWGDNAGWRFAMLLGIESSQLSRLFQNPIDTRDWRLNNSRTK